MTDPIQVPGLWSIVEGGYSMKTSVEASYCDTYNNSDSHLSEDPGRRLAEDPGRLHGVAKMQMAMVLSSQRFCAISVPVNNRPKRTKRLKET